MTISSFLSRHFKLLMAITLIICITLLYIYNPIGNIWAPKCAFKLLTGYDCPGCGAQRAIHALLHGHFAEALSFNYFMVYSVPFFLIVLYTEYFAKGTLKTRLRHLFEGKIAITLYITLFIIWGVVRNILHF